MGESNAYYSLIVRVKSSECAVTLFSYSLGRIMGMCKIIHTISDILKA